MFAKTAALLLALCVALCAAQLQFPSFAPQSPHNSQQYPRIKIGGPLGQLIPNGFQLGAGLGSVVNSLIGNADQKDTFQSASNTPYASAIRPQFPQFQQFQQSSGQQPPQQWRPQQQSQQSPHFSSQLLESLYNSQFGQQLSPLLGHSSHLGSTNSETNFQ